MYKRSFFQIKKIVFSARDAEEREKWVNALEITIMRHSTSSKVDTLCPQWTKFLVQHVLHTKVDVLEIQMQIQTDVCMKLLTCFLQCTVLL